jgi:hypothetical protein
VTVEALFGIHGRKAEEGMGEGIERLSHVSQCDVLLNMRVYSSEIDRVGVR